MKLASLKSGNRDGTLIVVNHSLTRAVIVPEIASTLQEALDHWPETRPELQHVYDLLNEDGVAGTIAFNPSGVHAPLPRAYQWADGSAYVTHVELVRKARGAEMPENFWTDPLMYQGGSDKFIGARDAIQVESEDYGIDFESEVVVFTDDVPMGIDAYHARSHIKLISLVNDVSLRNLIPNELSKGFGFFQSKPATSFAPVAVTPDELGNAWDEERLHLPLYTYLNDIPFGKPNAGIDMTFSFPELIAHAAKTRFLGAGTIIGSGTVSNKNSRVGSSCLAERRTLEVLHKGRAQTPFLKFGDRVRIEMLDRNGHNIFGSIDQVVEKYTYDPQPKRY